MLVRDIEPEGHAWSHWALWAAFLGPIYSRRVLLVIPKGKKSVCGFKSHTRQEHREGVWHA